MVVQTDFIDHNIKMDELRFSLQMVEIRFPFVKEGKRGSKRTNTFEK